MSCSIMQTINSTDQSVLENGTINLGGVSRKYGNDVVLNSNTISIIGDRYYEIKANIVLTPAAEGNITVQMYDNGIAVAGAIATGSVATVGNTITLPIDYVIRRPCKCANADNITFVLADGAATINNIITITTKLLN